MQGCRSATWRLVGCGLATAAGLLLACTFGSGDGGPSGGQTDPSGTDGPQPTDDAAQTVTSGAGDDTGPTAGASSDGGPAAHPGPWDYGWPIPAEPQTEGDPAVGWHTMTEGTILTCGVPVVFWGLLRPFLGLLAQGEPLPGRTGDNAQMPYGTTVHTPASGVKMASQNCLACHAGYFNGALVVGLGDAQKDFTFDAAALLDAAPIADLPPGGPLSELLRYFDRLDGMGANTVMRTVGTNPAQMAAISLVAHRDVNTLAWSDEPHYDVPPVPVPSDVPPWWRAHKKHALFYNAMARGDHRGTMMLATALCTDTVGEAAEIAERFSDVHAYVRSVRAPTYPFAIDAGLAEQGEEIFAADCAGCHGTYGATDAQDTYPNLLLPLSVVGTDPVVAEGGTLWAPYLVDWYNESYFGTITRMEVDNPWPGYAAPPLDGVWATGPFLHNGSVPNIALVLDSTRRPTYWRRVDYDSTHFDQASLGWPYLTEPVGHDAMDPAQAKWVYDTTQFGHGNEGHPFGDHLSDAERAAVLEYLKTL